MSANLTTPIILPTNQKFGWFFSAVFALAACWLFWQFETGFSYLFLILSIFVAIITLSVPHLLEPFNRSWYSLGLLLGRIVNPIVLGFIFFFLITPVSLIGRIFRRDVLRLKKRSEQSYWVDREPPGPPSDSFKNQY